jgi:hypothetical protein
MRLQKPGLLAIVCVCLVVVAGCAAPATATPLPAPATAAPPTPAPAAPVAAPAPDVLKAYEEALNRGDANAVLAVLVDEGLKYVDVGSLDADDKASVRNYLEWLIGAGTKVAIQDCTVEGETWRCTLAAHDDCMGAFPGLDEFHSDLTAKMKDGKIQMMLFAVRSADAQVHEQEAPKLVEWVQANRPNDMAKLMGNDYNRANGELWSEVCRAYIATLK